MAAKAEKTEELTIPDGGIGGLVMDDAEIEAAYGKDNDDSDGSDGVEEFGTEGIAQFPALTKKMAAMGRDGDDVVAHLQSGELVIPAKLLEDNPDMKETIFAFLEGQGIEDPQRYVVGSDANSINPDTGAAEFFFKKIKKALKSVVKVVKKVAPIVLPIALSFTPLGPVFGSALGSGIGTLIQGGSLKDAFKSALIGGATGAAFSGLTGPGTFLENVSNSVANPIGRFGQTISGAQSSLSSALGGSASGPGFFSSFQAPGLAAEQMATAELSVSPEAPSTTAITPGDAASQATSVTPTVTEAPGFRESIQDAFTEGGRSFTESLGDAFFPSTTMSGGTLGSEVITNPTASQYLTASGVNPLSATAAQQTAASNLISSAAPGTLRTYGPLAAAGLGLASATGAFSPVEGEPPNLARRDEDGNLITGTTIVEQDPEQYLIGDLGEVRLDPQTGTYVPVDAAPTQIPQYSVPTQFPYRPNQDYLMGSTPGGPFDRPFVTAADGGAIFPRRNGGIMPDEGLPGQDSVRAMLMPGEFVMTTDAVRGLGDGNLDNGIKNMYSVMRNLERRGRAVA